MPRREINNPTSRIIRLLDSFDEHEAYIQAIEQRLAEIGTLEGLPPRPSREHFAVESERQRLLGRKVQRDRAYAQRMRLMEGQPKTLKQAVDLQVQRSTLTPERMAEIDKLIEEMEPPKLSPSLTIKPGGQSPGEPEPESTGDLDLEALSKGKGIF